MKIRKPIFVVCLLLLCSASASQAWAQQCARIKLPQGQDTVVLNGKVVGAKKNACYKLHAREGRHATVHLTSADKSARFSIGPDEYDADFLEGAVDVSDWQGELSSASGNGNFLIVVSAKRAGAPFTLKVSIR